jgi:hypothetical protein
MWGAADCHAAQMHKLETTFLYNANFVRRLKRFEYDRDLFGAHP